MKQSETLSFRLSVQLIAVVIIVTVITTFFIFREVKSDTELMFGRSLTGLMSSVHKMMDVYNSELEFEADRLSATFGELFPGSFAINSSATGLR